jgi:hypothetical protein
MLERHTEKARRVIFFARYQASNYGSTEIDTEHLLLGILRETAHVRTMFPPQLRGYRMVLHPKAFLLDRQESHR